MAKVIKTTFKLRRDTAENWARNNPVLAQAEPGYETDTRCLKIGDGTTDWNNLPYFGTNNTPGGEPVEMTDELIKHLEEYYNNSSKFINDDISKIKNYAFFNNSPAEVSCANATEIGAGAFMNFNLATVTLGDSYYQPLYEDFYYWSRITGPDLCEITTLLLTGSFPENPEQWNLYYQAIALDYQPNEDIPMSPVALLSAPPVGNLRKASFPSCEKIGAYSFFDQTQLSEVDLSNVSTVEARAFALCTKLKEINLPKATKIGSGAFAGCVNLETFIANDLKECYSDTFLGMDDVSQEQTFIFPKLTKILSPLSYGGCGHSYSFIGENSDNTINVVFGGESVIKYWDGSYPEQSFRYIIDDFESNNSNRFIWMRESLISPFISYYFSTATEADFVNKKIFPIEGTKYEKYIT